MNLARAKALRCRTKIKNAGTRVPNLLNASVERTIAIGRVALTSTALLAIYLDPTQPSRYAEAAYSILIGYVALALAIVAALWSRKWHGRTSTRGRLIHGADVVFVTVLVFLTEGVTSPFFVFFTFLLMAAALRWTWRGVLVTAAMLLLLFLGAATAGLLGRFVQLTELEYHRVIIRSGYLVVISALFVYVSALRNRDRQRLLSLAARPEEPTGFSGIPLEWLLAHAAELSQVPRVLVTWEYAEEPGSRAVIWENGSFRTEPPLSGLAEDELGQLSQRAFLSEDFASGTILTGGVWQSLPGLALPNALARYAVNSFATAPFSGLRCRGRVYLMDRERWGEDHIALAEILASQIGAEIDREALRNEVEASAAVRERIRLGRDLHDSVLQGLTAVNLQLKLVADRSESEDKNELDALRQQLTEEQRRVRRFVERSRTELADGAETAFEPALRGHVAQLSEQWRCNIALAVEPPDARVDSRLFEEFKLLLAEAVANSARHGGAKSISVAVRVAECRLHVELADDGTGFPLPPGRYGPGSSEWRGFQPLSLCGRVAVLGGTVALSTSDAGATLHIEVPLG